MSDKVEGVGNEMYPLVTTDDGRLVLYRQSGDAWQVAASEQDVDFLTDPTRHRGGIEIVLARLTCPEALSPQEAERAFILLRKDEIGNHEGYPVAVYTDREACKADLEHRQSINPNAFYYVLDKKFNPKRVVDGQLRAPAAARNQEEERDA